MQVTQILEQSILPNLASHLQTIIRQVANRGLEDLVEIRLRANQPLLLETTRQELMVNKQGRIITTTSKAYKITKEDIKETLNLMTNSSLYALEDELRSGFITLPGGHRVGLVGQVVRNKSGIERIKHISGLNIRICQEVIGAADSVIDQVINRSQDIHNTLLISPPRCGKTTLLRDLVRQISDGVARLGFKGLKVGVVDERSEIGGSYQGVVQNELGIRTDLLDRAPKPEGILLLIRSMSPDVIATDEIGTKEDVDILQEALHAGVRIVTTVHGSSLAEVQSRPSLQGLFKSNTFQRMIILSRRQGPGTIERIIKR